MVSALPLELPPLRVGSACFGIGGLDLGLAWAGMTTVWLIEKDPQRRKWAKRNFPGAKQYDDMRQLDAIGYAGLESVDVVCGGIPCQPASLSGKRKGAADDRWLWPEAVRLVAAVRPTWCLFENPAGFITLGLDGVLSELESAGYAAWPIILPACAVDAPHRRDRVFIVAHAAGGGRTGRQDQQGEREAERRGVTDSCPGAVEYATGVGRRQGRAEPMLYRGGDATSGPGVSHGTLGDTNPQGSPLCQQPGEPEQAESREHTGAAAAQRGCPPVRPWDGAEWACGDDGKHRRVPSAESGLGLLAHGVPGRVAQISGFGDAVVPYVAYEIGLAIIAAHYGLTETGEVAA